MHTYFVYLSSFDYDSYSKSCGFDCVSKMSYFDVTINNWRLTRLTTQSSICIKWTASSEFGTYRLCEQRRVRQACASTLIQAVSQEEPSDRKPDPWPPLNGWACAVKICHDGMLEDTNSLDAPQVACSINNVSAPELLKSLKTIFKRNVQCSMTNQFIIVSLAW